MSNSPFNSNFNLLNVIFMFKEMSWFVKNAFDNVYPCISKIWTVSKLKLLIMCLAKTDCVDQSPLQRAVLYVHLQIVNYRWFKMFIWFETNEEKNNWDKTCFNRKMTLNEHSAYKESVKNDNSAKKNGSQIGSFVHNYFILDTCKCVIRFATGIIAS